MPKEFDPKVIDEAIRAGNAGDTCAFSDALHQLADPWDRVELLHELGRRGASDNDDKPQQPRLGFGIAMTTAWGSSSLGQVAGPNGMRYELRISGKDVQEKAPGCSKDNPLVS